MSEFEFIYSSLSNTPKDDSVALGIGDDAAVINTPQGCQLVQTMDTMVDGLHFDDRFTADTLAHKLLHVNLSDIAAMGAIPKWATVSLSAPQLDPQWLDELSKAMQAGCKEHGVNLIGGDTTGTSGPMVLTMNLTGIVKTGEYITRNQAKEGDDIYVTGDLGSAALALTEQGIGNKALEQRLLKPQARLDVGKGLYGIANACLDLSDGLLADLNHICRQSGLKAQIDVDKVPVSEAYKAYFEASDSSEELNKDYALNGGDDYELCFTASSSSETIQRIAELAKQSQTPIIKVGRMVLKEGSSIENNNIELLLNGKPYVCKREGWEHS